ncbi:DEAD/DEAH box helicase [Pyrobaculum sp. 3827-6]|uniref:DEAD/DEAH box helicase n=1 Tax=Pyrobaculum sp. 3827-6 TaxID=2983604 RepID=UPI0021D871E8|nr:DEAD/DEAH box helicase [Pyrobaculum sp. 3827-6]MCU7788385.1 DEAD/DEAH box helicase [Pyrobaculum sp. 3827-6]
MPRFVVVVNGVEVAREWPWERIYATKEELKRLGFRWDGAGWRIKTRDVSILTRLRQLLELSHEEYLSLLSSISHDSSGGSIVVVGRLPEELKPHVVAGEGGAHVVSLSGFLRRFVAEDKSVASAATFEEFVDMGVERLRKLLAGVEVWGDLEGALRSAREFVLASERLRAVFERRRSWRAAAVGPGWARLNFLASGLLKRLSEFRLAYNVVNREGELVERSIKLVKVEQSGGAYLVKFPVFVRDRVVKVLKELGYVVELEEAAYPRVEYRGGFSLFPFQREAVDNWASHGMRGTVIIPTGGGKTFVGLEAMRRAGTSALVLVVTKELAAQWVERIRKYLGVSPGVLGGGSREVRDVTVAIYNSAVKYIDELVGRFGLVVFDEAHHVPAETFKEVALSLDSPLRLALSATPEREDKNEHLIYEAVGPPVYRASYRSMVEAGLVVPVEHYRVYVRMSREEERSYASLPSDNAIVLRNAAAKAGAKIPVAVRIVAREVALGSKVLVFTQFIDQAEELYRRLREAGVAAELITSEEGNREAAFRRFSAGVSKVVVTTTVLDEGVDVPDAEVAVVVSGTGSRRQMIQRVGRVVRATSGKRAARVYELVARGTIEEALSEARHFDEVVEEAVCRRVTEADLESLLGRAAPLTSWMKRG